MRRHEHRNEAGMALLLTVLVAIVILGALTLVVGAVFSEKQSADRAVSEVRLEEACQAGIDLALQQLWNGYVQASGNTPGNFTSYVTYLNNNFAWRNADGSATPLQVLNNEDLNGNGTQDNGESDLNGDGVFQMNAPLQALSPAQPYVLPTGVSIINLFIARTDDLTGATLTITATAQLASVSKTATQTARISGQLFEGFNFAILANNINCILCHAKISSVDLLNNADSNLYGTFDRVKIASLQSMLIRTSENIQTRLAGTVYCRGQIYNNSGALMSAAQIAGSTFMGYGISNQDGTILQNAAGAMTNNVPLQNATLDGAGKLNQFANLYMEYPTSPTAMTDGNVPTSFPAPIPDENENRLVDDAEFQKTMNVANGRISLNSTGGVAFGVPAGSSYTATTLPAASNGALATLQSTGKYDGNLILIGTAADPIQIDSDVSINGDLVLQGPVKGTGQITARGNIYVTGDVTYADAPGQFGKASDGTTNALALVAGGNILMGDYLTIRGVNNSNDTSKYPDYNGAVNYRASTNTVSLTSGSSTQSIKNGYFDPKVVDRGFIDSTQPKFNQYSFSTSELMLFNNLERTKAQADATYTPRYYRLRPSAPVYTYTASDEHAVKYTDAGVGTMPAADLTNATILSLSPTNAWLSENSLRNFWYADEMSRPAAGRPFQFDGLLYSSNAIFFITHSNMRTATGGHRSNTYGQATIRGGMVAADLGVFVPGSESQGVSRQALNLYYDPRVANFLRVEDTARVQFSRMTFRFQ